MDLNSIQNDMSYQVKFYKKFSKKTKLQAPLKIAGK